MNERRDDLKRHVPTNLAILAGFAAGAMLVAAATFLLVPHGYTAARGDPRYWLLMLPLIGWTWGAVSLASWALRLLPLLLVGAPVTCAGLLLVVESGRTGGETAALWALTVTSGVCAVLGGVALHRSPLWPFARRG